MKEYRKCLHCHAFIEGRSDKKFCSQLCRNNHNNAKRPFLDNAELVRWAFKQKGFDVSEKASKEIVQDYKKAIGYLLSE